MMKELPGLPKV
jgi:nucleoside-diphosphate-sugar epimerase